MTKLAKKGCSKIEIHGMYSDICIARLDASAVESLKRVFLAAYFEDYTLASEDDDQQIHDLQNYDAAYRETAYYDLQYFLNRGDQANSLSPPQRKAADNKFSTLTDGIYGLWINEGRANAHTEIDEEFRHEELHVQWRRIKHPIRLPPTMVRLTASQYDTTFSSIQYAGRELDIEHDEKHASLSIILGKRIFSAKQYFLDS